MKRIKKVIIILLLIILPKVNATSANISVSTSNTVVGGTGTATLTISGDGKHLGQIYGTFTCGGLGNKDLTYVESSSPATSKTYTISWKGSTAGVYTCSVTGLQVGVLEEPDKGLVSVSAASKTIKVVAASSGNSNNSSNSGNNSSSSNNSSNSNSGGTTANKKTYSSDNTLSSLSVDGYEIDPSFNKDTLEYKLEVDESVEEINVSAKANDAKAEVSGIGKISLSSGENTIEVKVIAENGNEKVYKIVVNVKDMNPIEVSIDSNTYTIVKKNNDLIDKLEKYEESVIKIDNQDVICYKNTNGSITLVILKDKDGKYAYYVYDAENNSYSLYRQLNYGNISLYYMDIPKKMIPLGYKKYTFDYDNDSFIGYKYNKKSEFYLFYAMNIDNSVLSLYKYDSKENTIQRYDSNGANYLKASMSDMVSKYKNMSYVSIFLIVAMVVMFLISFIVKKKKKIN